MVGAWCAFKEAGEADRGKVIAGMIEGDDSRGTRKTRNPVKDLSLALVE